MIMILPVQTVYLPLQNIPPTPTRKEQATIVEIENPPPGKYPAIVKQNKRHRFPIFTVTISLVQFCLFYGFGMNGESHNLLLLFGYDPYRRHEVWRFLTVCLAHASLTHVSSNLILQLILGVLLERVYDWWRIAVIYFASVIGSSLFISALSGQVYWLGCSGAVYGLLFAHISTIIVNWKEMDSKCCRLFWLLFYIALEVGYSFVAEVRMMNGLQVSHAGHLGGAVIGFLVSFKVFKTYENNTWQKKMQKMIVIFLASLFVLIFLVNTSFPSRYLDSHWNFEYKESYLRHTLDELTKDPGPKTFELRKWCGADESCRMMVRQNGTIPPQDFFGDWKETVEFRKICEEIEDCKPLLKPIPYENFTQTDQIIY